MLKALGFFAISLSALVGIVLLDWQTIRWGERVDLIQIGGTIALLAIAGVLFRSGSEAWAVRHERELSLDADFPDSARIVNDGLRLKLRPTVTDREGRTAKIDLTVDRLAKVDGVLWIAGRDGKGHARAVSMDAVSYIIESRTGQFVADDLSRWVLSRATGWRTDR